MGLRNGQMGGFKEWVGGGMGGWVGRGMGGLQKLITDLDMRNGHKGGA